jgi:putative serine protease PepD
VLIAAVTALITSLIVGPAASVATAYFLSEQVAANPAATSAASGDVTKVAAKALPSVVSIATAEGGGSGFIIRDDGLIVTNNHVVSDAQELTVLFHDGSQASATIVGTDPVSDLAVIRAQGVSGLTPASLGDSDQVEVGAEVVAIGAPLGLSGTVTSGVVSAVERPVNTGVSGQQDSPLLPSPDEEEPQATTSTVIDAIQTDAPINPGNSGGPLVNMNGEVIGINTAIATTSGNFMSQSGSIGLGFAIPINTARSVAEEIIRTGSVVHSTIGVNARSATDGTTDGAQVQNVEDGGPAAAAGIEEGDVIVKVGDRTVGNADELQVAVQDHQPGESVPVVLLRDGRSMTVQVVMAAD